VTDGVRGPLDQQPAEPGWWIASDGKWYPPESAPTVPTVTVDPDPTRAWPAAAPAAAGTSLFGWLRSWPLWAKIAAPVVALFLIGGIAGAATASNAPAKSAERSSPSVEPTTAPTTQPTTSTTAPQTTTTTPPTTVPPTTVPPTTAPLTVPPVTAPPPTAPPATAPRPTAPPVTAPRAPATPPPPTQAPQIQSPSPPPAPSGGCTPGYDPCIPPGPDVDCAGGSGNGPRYVQGPVTVTGSDPYGLDADHDGIGCE
jgi:hypothetical protein